MRIHGLLTVLAILIIAAGFVPQYMGDIGSMTGEHTGVMLADELGTINDEFSFSFKDGLRPDTLVMEYYDGTDYITVTDEIAQQFYSYYLLNNDSSQKLFLDGTYEDGKFTDLSGNNNHGTPYNGATTGTGVVGDGMSFDGVDDYLIFPYITYDNNWSVSAWIYASEIEWNTLFEKIGYSNELSTRITGGFMFRDFQSTGYIIYTMVEPYSTDAWYHVVFVCNDTQINVYGNGVSSVTGFSTPPSTTKLELNGMSKDRTYWGNVDEIRIYDRALSENEVEVLNDVPLLMQEWNGYELYASYEYMDTYSPIATDLFTVGFPVLGIVILVFVGASYLYNN